jgi:hypothetical protein
VTDEQLEQMAIDHAGDIADDVLELIYQRAEDIDPGRRSRIITLARRTLLDFAALVQRDEFVERWKPGSKP